MLNLTKKRKRKKNTNIRYTTVGLFAVAYGELSKGESSLYKMTSITKTKSTNDAHNTLLWSVLIERVDEVNIAFLLFF